MPDEEAKDKFKAQILCVDDEPNILTALKRTFRGMGHDIHLANSGAEGLQLLEQHPINLVISDMRMPEMDGAEFLKRVQEQYPSVARILLTGFSDLNSTVKAVNEGKISGYISKPWDDNELRMKVKETLRVHFLEKERKRLLALTHKQNKKLVALNEKLEEKVLERTAELKQTADMLDEAYRDLSRSYDTLVIMLSNIALLRQGISNERFSLLPQLALRFAQKVVGNDHFAKQVYYAALLFELGKVGMPDDILKKPLALLNDQEKQLYYRYPATGEAALMSIPILSDTAAIIRHHCEYIDGSGYPDNLSGEGIPLGARLLSIVKDYFFLQWGISNGEEVTAKDARAFLESMGGKRYDDALLKSFIPLAKEFEQEHSVTEEQVLNCMQLRKGMTLSRDCVNKKGLLLLTKGTELSDVVINKLLALEKMHNTPLQVYVERKR